MIHNDCESDYKDLLEMCGKPTMNIKRIKQLTIKIFKTVNNLEPNFRKNMKISSYEDFY